MKIRYGLFFCLLVVALFLFIVIAFAEEQKTDGWEITQYAESTDQQGMFYSIFNPADSTLILIDSGNPENADLVRKVIDTHGGHVNAWFLTHYHRDHIGAFTEVYEEYRPCIDRLFVTPFDWDTYQQKAKDWDGPEAYETFLEKTKDAVNITALQRGDELEIDGLKIKVFNAFDPQVENLSTDWLNDCSLVLKFSADSESMLFLANLSRKGIPLANYILETFGTENIRSEYVQAGHHGNWGLPIDFYEKLRPKDLFFSAPEWLMTGEKYDAKDLEAWCKTEGIITHDFREGDVTIILH